MTFVKLSFTGAAKLQQDYHAWRSGDSKAGYEPVRTDYFDDGRIPEYISVHILTGV